MVCENGLNDFDSRTVFEYFVVLAYIKSKINSK